MHFNVIVISGTYVLILYFTSLHLVLRSCVILIKRFILMINICKFCLHRYIATIDGAVSRRHLIAISEGTVIEGIHCTPDLVELLPRQPDKPRPCLRVVVCFPYVVCNLLQCH